MTFSLKLCCCCFLMLMLFDYCPNSFNYLLSFRLNFLTHFCFCACSACHAWPHRSNGFDWKTWSSGVYATVLTSKSTILQFDTCWENVSLLSINLFLSVLFFPPGSPWCLRTERRVWRSWTSGTNCSSSILSCNILNVF